MAKLADEASFESDHRVISHNRAQRTIERSKNVTGVGFLSGADIRMRFLPAPPDHGIAFQRIDLPGTNPIPARIENVIPQSRRTIIEQDGVRVELIEHVMAALAGLRIDNCLVQLNAYEPPGCDGSSRLFADTLLDAGVVEQDQPRRVLQLAAPVTVTDPRSGAQIQARPVKQPVLAITYQLDYGPRSPIVPQTLTVEITPKSFLFELSFARTFVLEQEAEALRKAGYGTRTTARDLLVFGDNGVIDNELRVADECVRHKILDCLGDFALIGCDLFGHFSAQRSGHVLNQDVVREIARAQLGAADDAPPVAA